MGQSPLQPSAPPSVQIPGYTLITEIGRGGMSTVFEAVRESGRYAIKLFKNQGVPYSPPGALGETSDPMVVFRREAATLARINHPGLVKVIEVGETEGFAYLVMEFVEGQSLAQGLTSGALSKADHLSLATALAEVLCEIHKWGLVHRDLKPANILMGEGGIKVIDFGLAIRSQSKDDIPSDHSIGGTFLYSAPEQIGIIKAAIDGRSDLYSLGCVLYEAATGQLPYYSPGLSELLNLLATEPVPDPRDFAKDLSPVMAMIIRKLLSKDPDDRYVNAFQLLSDLKNLHNLERDLQQGLEVKLGADLVAGLHLDTPLVGRRSELLALREHWRAAQAGDSRHVIIQGEPGSGKSRLARELLREAGDGATFINGKCASGAATPLGVIREAVDRFLRGFKVLPRAQAQEAHQKVRRALGEFAPLLIGFSHEISLLSPTLFESVQTPIDPESQEIFFDAVATFLHRLVCEFSPALLLVDDLQWLDDSSREVLGRLIKLARTSCFMLVGTCRTRADLTHVTATLPGSIPIVLSSLSVEEMGHLISLHLGGRALPKGEFVQRILRLSQGSPLAAGEYLRVMIESGCLYPVFGSWAADLSAMEKLNLSTDVIHLILQRLSFLDSDTQNVLRFAAVLGSTFEREILDKILGKPADLALLQAVQANLLIWEPPDQYAFVHDRVLEALLSKIPKDEFKAINQKAAEAFDTLSASKREEREVVFATARHYGLGEIKRNPGRAYDANFNAGSLALACYSHQEALEFLAKAAQIQKDEHLDRDRSMLLEAQGQAALRNDQNSDAAIKFEEALTLVQSPMRRAQLLSLVSQTLLGLVKMNEALEANERGYRELGHHTRISLLRRIVSIFCYLIADVFLYKTGWRFGKARGEGAEKHRILAKLGSWATLVAGSCGEIGLLFDCTLRQIYSAHFLGQSAELASAYASCALLFAGAKLRKRVDHCSKLSIEIAERLGNPILLAKVRADLGVAYYISGDYLGSKRMLDDSHVYEYQWHTKASLFVLAGVQTVSSFLRGHSKDYLKYVEEMLPAPGELGAGEFPAGAIASRMALRFLLGDVAGGMADREWFFELGGPSQLGGYFPHLSIACACFIFTNLEMDEPLEKSQEWIDRFRGINLSPLQMGILGHVFLVVHLYLRLSICFKQMRTSKKVRTSDLIEFESALKELKESRFVLTDQHCNVGNGALHWFRGETEVAVDALNFAESQARIHENNWARFEALQLRGAILQQEKPVPAQDDVLQAIALAEEQGWVGRVRRIKQIFRMDEALEISGGSRSAPYVSKKMERSHSLSVGNLSSSYQEHKFRRQLDALLRLNRASSSVGTPESQIAIALDEVIKVINAERAFLFLAEGDRNKLQMARDVHRQDLSDQSVYSRLVVERVRASGQALMFTGDKDEELITSQSLAALQIRSVMAAPLIKDERTLGVLYVDSTVSRGLFQKDDLEILSAIAGYLAVSLEAIRARHLEEEKRMLKKEQELTDVRVSSAHAAGMAEIATGSIHNIGNTLTMVITHFDLLKRRVMNSKLATFVDCTKVLAEHQGDLTHFVVHGSKGPPLMNLFVKLGEELDAERNEILDKIDTIERGISNVKEVIHVQQEYARSGLNSEVVDLSVVVEEVLQLQYATLERRSIFVEKSYIPIPKVSVQKNKLVNVLMNLLNNARDAMAELKSGKVIHIDTLEDETYCMIRIRDHGHGIAPENMTKIFSHSFTTKLEGHGFGLHMSANAMSEMGGKIEADSLGVGLGATFTVSIPKVPHTELNPIRAQEPLVGVRSTHTTPSRRPA